MTQSIDIKVQAGAPTQPREEPESDSSGPDGHGGESPARAEPEEPQGSASLDADAAFQHTVAGPSIVRGRGLFRGAPVECTITPAPVDHGVVFERVDLDPPIQIQATISNVTPRTRRTTLKVGDVAVETVEHCLAALSGLGVDNAVVKLTGPELPCGDGSAKPFVEAILSAGLQRQDAPRRFCTVAEPITVEEDGAMIVALPGQSDDLQILYDLDYGDDHRIPRQVHAFRLPSDSFATELAPARTYSLRHEAEALWERGLCKHLTPEEVLVIDENGPIRNVYRFDNEPVRHKVLDVIGDLALLGRPIQGRIVAYRSGHSLNHQLVYRLLEKLRTEQGLYLHQRRQMDVRAIMKIMRHRYPMLMVDRVVEIHGDQRAVGVKNVTINEPYFQGHYPGSPIMPGVMIVEAMAQLSGLLLSRVLEHTGKIAVLLSMDRVKLRRPVVPGDQLVLEAETVRARARTASVKCKAFVLGDLAAEAHIKFLMIDADDEGN